MVALCHLFVFVEPGTTAPGLQESFRRAHPGQGTANVCYCFDNAYLELLWLTDRVEATAPAIARTRLAERAAWRSNGASPFGVAVRPDAADAPLPFPAWDYRPPYLPPGMAIPVAEASDDIRQPFLFRSPGSTRPDQWTDGRAGERQRAAGLAEVTGVHLDLPQGIAPDPAFRALGLLSLGTADEPRLVLTLSRADDGAPRRLTLPDFRWDD